jgi:hypothetical protein
MVLQDETFLETCTCSTSTEWLRMRSEVWVPIKQSEQLSGSGKAIGTLAPLLESFDQRINVKEASGSHRRASMKKDIKKW